MLTQVLIAGTMMIAGPALGQVAQSTRPAPATSAQDQSTTVDRSATTADTQATSQAPMQSTQGSDTPQAAQATPPDQPTAAPDAQAAQAQPAPSASGQPAAGNSAVAQVVDQGWSTYDKNGDGKLSESEFGAWMVALKQQSDPATKATSPATRKYVATAFAQADKDKSRSVSKGELTSFLGQG